jgi:hypothetical protein
MGQRQTEVEGAILREPAGQLERLFALLYGFPVAPQLIIVGREVAAQLGPLDLVLDRKSVV